MIIVLCLRHCFVLHTVERWLLFLNVVYMYNSIALCKLPDSFFLQN